ncbi:fungal-specific transcription factor domain-domain-containing protein [Aspergillus taichungensis]|uniref:Fungal-specific transcription factor domain-domain-containing protein n=1 Tax=Aspergillus taichungensis TaxID=482145 RepID=A0A2J5HJE5_9EURO|nr:fungal-specific transcription factor domain-domain-containing protein [Aspergillus taichungensis]
METTTLVTRVETKRPPAHYNQSGGSQLTRKRKTSESSSPTTTDSNNNNRSNGRRQKITRACDQCKEKKTRCTGTLPCFRCTRLSLSCKYNAAYSRGLPPVPLPLPSSETDVSHSSSKHATVTSQASWNPVSQLSPRRLRGRSPSSRQDRPKNDLGAVTRNSPDPIATDFEGNYLGPASGVSFLNRVWRRLRQDEMRTFPNQCDTEASSKNTSVFMFGDNPYDAYHETGFTLPSYEKALSLVGVYFDYSIVTYRFLHRGSVEEWLRQVYEHNISSTNLPTGPMLARTAIVLMVFAVSTLYEELEPGSQRDPWDRSERWYAASKHMSAMESGPPRLETVQARLGQCLYLLGSSRANECWYVFGTALQLVTALGLHRKCLARSSKRGTTYLEQELRKRIFWSAYTLDKYLCVMFGRPRLLHDEDIDQELPDEMSDDDLLQENPKSRTGTPDCMMIASVLHFRLGRILGDISRQVYSLNPHCRDPPLEMAARLTAELEQWKETTPPIFNSVCPTSLIPPLCRQSQVLQMAYSHAMIHVTRSFLLNDFTDLTRRPSVPDPMVATHVRKCIDAAENVLALVDSLAKQGAFIQSFWFTHYVCFCAIIVVYIYTIQQHRLFSALEDSSLGNTEDTSRSMSLFAVGETCQQHLAEATRKNCPSRRYSIILEELRLEVHRQLGPRLPPPHSGGASGPSDNHQSPIVAQETVGLPHTDQSLLLDPSSLDYADSLQPPDLGGALFEPSEDPGFLENLDGSIWWTQLDSWAFMNLQNDPSMMPF